MPFKCTSCDKEFQSSEALAQHSRDKHGAGKESKTESKAERKELEVQTKKEKKESELEKSIKAKKMKRIAKYSVILLVIIVLLYFTVISLPPSAAGLKEGLGAVGSQHVHSDIKVYLDGKAIDFSQPRYQLKSQHVHMEGGDGNVIHVHATGVKMGYFLSTLNIKFNETCIVMDNSRNYCSSENKTLRFYVNDNANDDWENYVMQSTDRILISYGNETNLTSQLDSVTTKGAALDTGTRR